MKYTVLNLNYQLRLFLYDWVSNYREQNHKLDPEITEVENIKTSYVQTAEFIEATEKENKSLYRLLISLLFSDTYCNIAYILTHRAQYADMDLSNIECWNYIQDLNSVDDVIDLVKKGKLSLPKMVENSVHFLVKDDYDKALCFAECNMGYLVKISPFAMFEWDDLFAPADLEDIVADYQEIADAISEYYDEHPEDEEEYDPTVEETVVAFIDQASYVDELIDYLKIQQFYDYALFKRTMIEVINLVYRFYKSIDEDEEISATFDGLAEDEAAILDILENQPLSVILDLVLTDYNAIKMILLAYLNLKTGLMEIDVDDLVETSEDYVDEKVMKKFYGGNNESH